MPPWAASDPEVEVGIPSGRLLLQCVMDPDCQREDGVLPPKCGSVFNKGARWVKPPALPTPAPVSGGSASDWISGSPGDGLGDLSSYLASLGTVTDPKGYDQLLSPSDRSAQVQHFYQRTTA